MCSRGFIRHLYKATSCMIRDISMYVLRIVDVMNNIDLSYCASLWFSCIVCVSWIDCGSSL